MWTVWDTKREEGHGKRKRGSISLRVLALMDLAPSPSRARHQSDSPSRLSRSGTALKRVHAIREGLRVRGALAASTRKPEGTPISTDGPSVFGKDTGQGVTAVREWNPFWLGVSALTTRKGYKTLRKFKEKFRFNFWTFTTKNTRLHPSNPPIEPNPPVWLIPGGVW